METLARLESLYWIAISIGVFVGLYYLYKWYTKASNAWDTWKPTPVTNMFSPHDEKTGEAIAPPPGVDKIDWLFMHPEDSEVI
jgi:hypothetical protein